MNRQQNKAWSAVLENSTARMDLVVSVVLVAAAMTGVFYAWVMYSLWGR